PSIAPPVLIDPTPPAAPLQNPPRPVPVPVPIIPPRAGPPEPAPAAIDSTGTSRRTAMIKAQPVRSNKPAETSVVVKHRLPPIAAPAYDAPAATVTAPIR